MIRTDKYNQALQVLNGIMIRARFLAYEGNAQEVADLLDAAEILPQYMAQPEDATELFRLTLQAISQEHTSCAHLIREFDKDYVVVQK